MKILITGGAGFVGSSLCIKLKEKYPHYSIIAFDNLKRRGSELNLPRFKTIGVEFVHGDIRNRSDFDEIGQVDCILDAAAEPSVMAGIDSSPDYLIDTNLNGTINSLLFAKQHKADFIFLSTSRVYPIAAIEKMAYLEGNTRFEIDPNQVLKGITSNGIAEDFPTEGSRSFYGATKLASEILITEFNEFAGIRTVINRCGVIAGPWQMGKVDQGVTSLWVARHFWKKPLSYIGYGGTGKQVRDVLHIDDLLDLVDWQLHHMNEVNNQTFNAGGGLASSYSLKELTQICEEITGNKIDIKSITENREADIRIYITDNTKVTNFCGWKPKREAKQIVEDIFHWIKENEKDLHSILNP